MIDLDLETYSEVDITKAGAAAYGRHPSTDIICAAFSIDEGPIQIWVPKDYYTPTLFSDLDVVHALPDRLVAGIESGEHVRAWNSAFEYAVWNHAGRRRGFPKLKLCQMVDPMAQSYAFSLPGALGSAAAALKAEIQKNTEGKRLIKLFSVPDSKGRRTAPTEHPADAERFFQYCRQDVAAQVSVSRRLPMLSPFERRVWEVDQKINERGIPVDISGLKTCLRIAVEAQHTGAAAFAAATDGAVNSPGELSKIQLLLRDQYGLDLPDLRSDTVESALRREGLDPKARRILELRSAYGLSSPKKLSAMLTRVCDDGRIRGLLAYHGAQRTGRWAGRGPQPQNQPSNTWPEKEIDRFLADAHGRSAREIESRYGNPLEAVSKCLRGLFSAAEGRVFVSSDYTAIEPVSLAEMAGETWMREVFRGDGRIYEATASRITGVSLEEMARHKSATGENHPMRKLGKVASLASGYGGGPAAWSRFGAHNFLTEKEIVKSVRAWRDSAKKIVGFWYGLEKAAIQAVMEPRRIYEYECIRYQFREGVLLCQLPSGRTLKYLDPKVSYDQARQKHQLEYASVDRLGRLVRERTYGGKLTENVVQAVSRDILANALVRLDDQGFNIVLHIHDEIVSEENNASALAKLESEMVIMPDWAKDWPIRADGGWAGKRFRKG